jgi:hypothetical protein
MSRLSTVAAAIALLGALAFPQDILRSRLQPVTAPVRRAGVFNVATGTWTRNASFANVTGPDTIYNNTCNSGGYFGHQSTGEKWQHRSRVPSPTGPYSPSVFYGLPRFDEAPGCQTSYTINGFEVAYCSSIAQMGGVGLTYRYEFANIYDVCGAADMVPDYSFTVTGLPVGTSTGGQQCWVIDVDLSGTTPAFVLQADGNGVYDGSDHFGFSLGPTSSGVSGLSSTGPIIAGDITWTGGAQTGLLTPCTGTDGTIWDSPINLSEAGTGMSSNDFFRIAGITTDPGGPGCYYFGGNPHADFYLKLFANPGCPPPTSMVPFCFPGQVGVVSCPCANPPASNRRGCDNFGAMSGGAMLSSVGTASLAQDTLELIALGENASAFTIFLQATAQLPSGTTFGAGVSCIQTNLKRLYTGNALAGAISRPASGNLSVHARSRQLGDTISAGQHRYYMAYYRDPHAAGPCGSTASTFNASPAGDVLWSP